MDRQHGKLDPVGRGVNRYLGRGCALSLLGALVPSGVVNAASFDCKKAKTEVEKIICAGAGLSKLDDEMANAYAEAKTKAGKLVRSEQKQWLKDREFNSASDGDPTARIALQISGHRA